MDVTAAISSINYALRGTDEDAPSEGTDEWNYWLFFLNLKKNELYRDTEKNWPESHTTQSIGTVAAATSPSLEIPSNFLAPSGDGDGVGAYVVASGQRIDLDLVKPEEKRQDKRRVYIDGVNPRVLRFCDELTADDAIVGGTLYLPGYYLPADFENAGDTLTFPDNNWAVVSTAAEIAFNDVTYEDKAEGLNARANNLYRMMVSNSLSSYAGKSRKLRTNVISGARAIRGLRRS